MMNKKILSGFLGLACIAGFALSSPVEAATRTQRSSGSESNETFYEGRMSSSMRKKIDKLGTDPVDHFPVPILLGVSPKNITDTWGEARSAGRTHEGTDIFAPRGAFVVSPTAAVVSSIGVGTIGGNYVYTSNPGGERYYFAHLDSVKKGLKVGDELKAGDLLGYVGNTGNAAGGPTHLHFGIYKRGATNPFERLSEEFTLKERVVALTKILKEADSEETLAQGLVSNYRSLFTEAVKEDIDIPNSIQDALQNSTEVAGAEASSMDLTLNSTGAGVIWLQEFLIRENKGTGAIALAGAGATGYFGPITRNALMEYQASVGIAPALGYFGPVTRAYLKSVNQLL